MSFARGLITQGEVVHALVMRETRTRFGRNQLGYVWALAEPALFVLTFYVIYALAGRVAPHEMDIFGFLVTGMVPFLLFRETAMRVSEAINGNRGMLFYPHVQPLDLVLARAFLEAATQSAVFLIMMGIVALVRQDFAIHDPLLVLIGLTSASLLGTGLGLVLCGLAQFSVVVDRIKGPLMRPFFWVSGIFFTATMIPAEGRHYMLYNPVLHIIEMVRSGWYRSYDSPYFDIAYPLAWAVGLLAVGLSLERVIRRRIELT